MRKRKVICCLIAFFLLFSINTAMPQQTKAVQAANNECKIHFLTLKDNTDAILLECNGKFGMVDSGEDTDYPSGKDSRYPLRAGVVKGKGFEGEVLSYMHSVGVTKNNFEFYIGTHPHSDHIGSADEVIYEFHPKRVYIEAYSDSDITDSSRLWDNLYVYDHMITAAKNTGATLIQTFNKNAPLYPETVTLRGTILYKTPSEDSPTDEPSNENQSTDESTDENLSEPDQPEEQENYDQAPPTDSAYSEEPKDTSQEDSALDTAPPDTAASVENPDNTSLPPKEETFGQETSNSQSPTDSPRPDEVPQNTPPEQTTPEEELPSQNAPDSEIDDSAQAPDSEMQTTAPESISITLQYVTTDKDTVVPKPVTISTAASSVSGKITKIGDNLWTYEFNGLQKYDNTKTEFDYSITPQADGYSFSVLDASSPYDFSCVSLTTENLSTSLNSNNISESISSIYEESQEDSGTIDEESEPSDSVQSDNMTTNDIPDTDQVDPNYPDDPLNRRAFSGAEPAKSGIYEGEVGAESTPVFYLGGKQGMKIEIMNYGVQRPQSDANYFSLGVKTTSVATGKTAFLAGDINNYLGTETQLAKTLGHVNVLKLGHHGSYGSNTYTYLKKLSPEIAIMTGKFDYVTNNKMGKEIGTLDTLLKMAQNGMPIYPTAWYAPYTKALVINLDNKLKNNIPKNKSFVAVSSFTTPSTQIYYQDGYPTAFSGWKESQDGNWYYFDNSYNSLADSWIKNASGQYYYVRGNGTMATGWVFVNGYWYYMDQKGIMTTGWQKIGDKWYYMNSSGQMLTGRQRIGMDYYYFSSTGAMADDEYIDGQYYNTAGKWQPDFSDSNWMHDANGYWYRFSNGSYPRNTWMRIHGTWYYFYASGYMATGWLKQNNDWYYLGSDGGMKIGWFPVNNVWYYFNSSGIMRTGLQNIGGQKYYFNISGAMLTGWYKINNKWYYFTGSGSAAVGWYQLGQTWYYSNSAGVMVTGLQNIGGQKYYFNNSGTMLTGWYNIKNKWYYFTGNGSAAIGWYQIGQTWYYSNSAGVMQTGWLRLGNTYYYLTPSGAMATGWLYLGNTWYYLNPSGEMYVGWLHLGNTWYYLNGSGAMLTGFRTINGQKYFLTGSGALYTGWGIVNNSWYYFTENGVAVGWANINNTWYYLNTSGIMLTGLQNINGQNYYLDSSGAMRTGWQYLNGKWYYFLEDGSAASGWKYINGNWYYLNPNNNQMYANAWTPDGYYVNSSGAWTGQRR